MIYDATTEFMQKQSTRAIAAPDGRKTVLKKTMSRNELVEALPLIIVALIARGAIYLEDGNSYDRQRASTTELTM